MTTDLALQEAFSPNGICFGCGPLNAHGLHVRSFPQTDGRVTATWTPESHHQAFPNVLNGGIIGALLDCHCNWAGAWYLMQDHNETVPPHTVTAQYTIKLKRPTPTDAPVELVATLKSINSARSVTVLGELIAHGKVCATCEGTFVAVSESHPGHFGD